MSTVASRNDIETAWSQHDDSCSKSCTRSGVAVLVLSAYALSMLPSLGKMEPLNALLGYISRRITLKENFGQLPSDSVWKRLKASDPTAETWELGKLLQYGENSTTKKPVQQSSKESIEGLPGKTGVVSDDISPESPPIGPPAAPTGLGFVVGIGPIPIIIKTLEELSDDAFLVRAQKYSYRYDNSIYRWSLLRNSFFIYTSDDSSKGQVPTTPGMKISKLTLPQVEELANFNLPEISESERLLKEGTFTFPSMGLPLGITSATLFVEIGLLLLTSYFWIWYREARLSPNFPASGTLFGALARSASSRLMFSLLIVSPPIAAALVALSTVWLTYWNVFLAILVTIVAFLIRRQGKLLNLTVMLQKIERGSPGDIQGDDFAV